MTPEPTPRNEQTPIVADEIEPTLTVAEIAGAWKKSADTVRRLFLDEPGVLRFGHGTLLAGRKYRRRYFSLRIPLSVFQRVEARLQRPRPSPERPLRRRVG